MAAATGPIASSGHCSPATAIKAGSSPPCASCARAFCYFPTKRIAGGTVIDAPDCRRMDLLQREWQEAMDAERDRYEERACCSCSKRLPSFNRPSGAMQRKSGKSAVFKSVRVRFSMWIVGSRITASGPSRRASSERPLELLRRVRGLFKARCRQSKFSLRALAAAFLLRRDKSSCRIAVADPLVRTVRREILGSSGPRANPGFSSAIDERPG
ncbi:hypothetical protein [Palleronia rufa]|uniref:hypothetical protein n=1 Tax=Palleronia rufa TaxID=1530186 RepID=UPI00126821BE|nr:hypothetical protein [Palleronia rufa]